MPEADAFICADNLVDADLSGVESHGVSRLGNYLKRLKTQVVACENRVRVVEEHAASLAIDGGNSMGMVVGTTSMHKCIEKARVSGSCFATAMNSNHYGMASYYVAMAAEAGMIGITGSNAPPNLAPWGSPQKYMGTNPIAFSAPTGGRPIILDMAPSVVAMGKIILAAKLGKSIPDGWVLDPDGKPTTDPVVGQHGTLVPIGGPKGSGLAIFGEILSGVLSGSNWGPHINHFWNDFENPQNVGHYFLAIDINKFIPYASFLDRITQMVDELKALPKSPGTKEIYLPGEIELLTKEKRKAHGIELPLSVYLELTELAERYQIAFEIDR
jgi:LDH2 family malate/lactate/ureidoglycolate dehydrogenase